MDKAKAAITDFMGRSGHHDTTVHEAVAPAITQEVVKPHVHEEVNTAIDKEVHQDHYHRTIQPVQDREVLPETHEAKIGAVQHREFDHRDHEATKRNLVVDQARFKDGRRVDQTTHSQSVAPVVGGEHVHHHIHETIQPVVQKETIQPNVVHTTVPIHEVHHNKATHHDTTALPAMSMEQFKAKGGALHGREERCDEFEGVPKNIGGVAGIASKSDSTEHSRHGDFDGAPGHRATAGVGAAAAGAGAAGLASHHHQRRGSDSSLSTSDEENPGSRIKRRTKRNRLGSAAGGAALGGKTANPLDRNNDGRVNARDLASSHSGATTEQGNFTGSSSQGGLSGSTNTHNPLDRNNDGRVDNRDLKDSSRSQNIGATGTGAHGNSHKPGLMDKLNPKVDADGNGKAGFLR